MSIASAIIDRKKTEMLVQIMNIGLSEPKFKKKSGFSLNLGNLYLILQLEMRPNAWLEQGF